MAFGARTQIKSGFSSVYMLQLIGTQIYDDPFWIYTGKNGFEYVVLSRVRIGRLR